MQTSLFKSTDEIEIAPGIVVPVEDLLNGSNEPNGRGIVTHNERRTFRLIDRMAADGRPVEVVVTLYAHRAPVNEAEAAAVAKTAKDRADKTAARTAADDLKRQREIKEACDRTESALAKGLQVAAAQGGNIAEKVKESLDLAATLAHVMGKASAQ